MYCEAAIPYEKMVAAQSSTTHSGVASRPLTANPQPTWPGTCSHTSNEANAWWKVSLTGVWSISSVTLTNRAGCCPERLQNIDIYIAGTKCASSVSINGGETKTIPCAGTGSEIKVQHQATSALTLCGFAAQGTQACRIIPSLFYFTLRPAYWDSSGHIWTQAPKESHMFKMRTINA